MSDETTEVLERIAKQKIQTLYKTMNAVDAIFQTIDQVNKQENTNYVVIIVANGNDTFVQSQLSPEHQIKLLEDITRQYKEINKQRMN